MKPFWTRRRDVDDEIESHIEEKTAELIDAGLSPPEARLRARREFGNLALIAENSRSVWGWTWLERLAQDLRYAARMLARTPGFTAVAVLSLALGIGANTAIFGLLDVILFRMLPVERPEELKIVNIRWRPDRKPDASLTHPCYRTLRDGNHTFRDLAAYGSLHVAGPLRRRGRNLALRANRVRQLLSGGRRSRRPRPHPRFPRTTSSKGPAAPTPSPPSLAMATGAVPSIATPASSAAPSTSTARGSPSSASQPPSSSA